VRRITCSFIVLALDIHVFCLLREAESVILHIMVKVWGMCSELNISCGRGQGVLCIVVNATRRPELGYAWECGVLYPINIIRVGLGSGHITCRSVHALNFRVWNEKFEMVSHFSNSSWNLIGHVYKENAPCWNLIGHFEIGQWPAAIFFVSETFLKCFCHTTDPTPYWVLHVACSYLQPTTDNL